MRIIAGKARGRRLAAPPGTATRPTADRAREGLFSAVMSHIDGARWLDLYAGSGAVGLEALSRGAAEVVLVESHPRAAAVIRENIERVGLPGARLEVAPVERFLAGEPQPFDVVFADPPYVVPLAKILHSLNDGGWLNRESLIVVERATRSGEFSWPPGYVPVKSRRYGEATFWYGRLA
jgi:16S rRNA (guanine966-N2)-methyltransferase